MSESSRTESSHTESDKSVESIPTPGVSRILLTLVGALVAAVIAVVTVVMPAEYGVDPTGVGKLLGLTELSGAIEVTSEDLEMAGDDIVAFSTQPFLAESISVEIAPDEEIEYKMRLIKGSSVVFSWQAEGGGLYTDFHAEPFNDLDGEEIRFGEDSTRESGHGSLRAPFNGLHGWYWRNDGQVPVQVSLSVSGYYTKMEEVHRGPAQGQRSSDNHDS